jgi:hypothetical protein
LANSTIPLNPLLENPLLEINFFQKLFCSTFSKSGFSKSGWIKIKFLLYIIIKMSNILFVCGFNTHPEQQNGTDLYCSFDIYFKFSDYKINYFRYKTTEDLFDVYQRLKDILDTQKHDLIITHSMGSCLVMKYIHETQDKRPCIMCMPFIHTSFISKLMSNIPLLEYLYIPKCCLIPNHHVVDGGNILNDELKLIYCNQVKTSIKYFFLTDEQLVETINTNNIQIIYALNELISPIDPFILSQIKSGKISYSSGKHTSFGNIFHMSNFFDKFTNTLQNKKTK